MMVRRMLLLLVFLSVHLGCGVVDDRDCEVCRRPLHQETFFRIHLNNGEVRKVCCPRCGLHFQAGRDDVARLETTDYPTGELMDAEEAYYVENSSVMLCCKMDKLHRDRSGGQFALGWDRCLPSLVSFGREEDAEEFRRQHGGRVRRLPELLAEDDFRP